jgi:DnaA family protein
MNSPKQLTFPWNRVNKSSFEGFYIDPKNAQLLSLLMDTSSSNDLFIHGFKDSGKTFLLQSLCNLYNTNNKTSLYLPLKEVMTYGVDILDSLEKMDLVCIDIVESIISNTEWEIAIFNLINNSFQSNCRLVFSSSLEKGGVNFNLADLDSRIRKLDSYELYAISDEHILKALKHIARLRSINLGDKEAQYLITYTKRDISELVQVLESLDQLSMEMKRKITIPLIKKLL